MITRAECRNELAVLLKGAIPEAREVFAYKTSDPGALSPIIVLASNGIRLSSLNTFKRRSLTYFIAINVLTRYSDPESGWTPQMAEDANDLIVHKVIQALDEHSEASSWYTATLQDRSFTDEIEIAGITYIAEVLVYAMEMRV